MPCPERLNRITFASPDSRAFTASSIAARIACADSGAGTNPCVRANCVAPGHVRTPMTAVWEQMPDAFEPIAAALPLGRIGEADEIAGAAVFLASKASSFVTGQAIVCDGGATV